MEKILQVIRYFVLKSLIGFGLNFLTLSKVIAFLIFTKLSRDLMEARHLVHYSR
jgi:hypothetical protein